MKESLIMDAYGIIEWYLNTNRDGKSIANELYNNYLLERDDLRQELITQFMEAEHQDIQDLKKYLCRFCRNRLLNIKKAQDRQKRCIRKFCVSLEDYLEKNKNIG
jgi:DNA-directed RNA polymerase specialized sigma24 family protein